MQDAIHQFLNSKTFAVAGASTDQNKFGKKVFRALLKSNRTTFPLNPKASQVEGIDAYSSIADVPESVDSLVLITPPPVTLQIVTQALEAGVRHFWMQPGAQHEEASRAALSAGASVVDDGSCLLIVLADER